MTEKNLNEMLANIKPGDEAEVTFPGGHKLVQLPIKTRGKIEEVFTVGGVKVSVIPLKVEMPQDSSNEVDTIEPILRNE